MSSFSVHISGDFGILLELIIPCVYLGGDNTFSNVRTHTDLVLQVKEAYDQKKCKSHRLR
jgi:hypothetical protein